MNKRLGYRLIRLGRKAFARTPIQRLKITGIVYEGIFRSMYPDAEATAEYKGVKLTVPTKDLSMVPSILGGYFESLELDYFARAAAASKTVVDVGANIGLYSCVAATRLQPGGVVHAFEPIAENLAFLQRNVLNNNLTNVDVHEEAVGEEEGNLEIFVSDKLIGTHSAAKAYSHGNSSVTVPMTSVDAFVESHGIAQVDLLKIDVEGYDGYVLKGAIRTIARHKPTIFIEYYPEAMKECGFEPSHFAELLFANYRHCLKLDEVNHKAPELTREALLSLEVYANENLIFTNEESLLSEPASKV